MHRNEYQEVICKNNGNKSNVYVCRFGDTTYYVEDGGKQINLTYQEIDEDTDINELVDYDVITCPDNIESLEDFSIFLSI